MLGDGKMDARLIGLTALFQKKGKITKKESER
jgi:hypothetical protein